MIKSKADAISWIERLKNETLYLNTIPFEVFESLANFIDVQSNVIEDLDVRINYLEEEITRACEFIGNNQAGEKGYNSGLQ